MHLPFDWCLVQELDGGLVMAHVMPINDLIEHDAQSDCICGPEDCVFSFQHNSLDGRELKRPDVP
jgi:hypothetical protein